MNEPTHSEVAILNAALELPAGQRTAYLESACGGDAALVQQVEGLLRAHQRAEGFMEAPAAGPAWRQTALTSLPLSEKPGDSIGRYKLLQKIGEGGCGVVYMAEQQEPVRRRVALKVIKLGMDTRQVIARFEAERQALALMDHPNIAKVLDAGATETGRPYFVMELVRGIKITDFCDEKHVPTVNRLKLFIQVCQAIQHAHQKGVIHRDIKPSNILVTVNDGLAVPKVIDFGIAKATTGQSLTDRTLFTAFEQFIGTPAYMSPEQAAMTSLDIDTRSDIYSLGVLLYELLTGQTPFDPKDLMAAGLDAMRQTIREKEPSKPSTRLSTMSADVLTAMASQRQIDPPRLIHLLRGDLDWIVMKSLEKDRARRYETASGLAADLRRHLDNEPISARPPSGAYRLQKLMQRNKATFGIAAVVGSAAVLAVVVLILSNVRIGEARRAEQAERQKSEVANRGLRSANTRLAETVTLLELRRAEDVFTAGDAAGGVAHLAAMLRRDPSNHIAASRLVAGLVHRNWALPSTPSMRHAGKVETVGFSPDGRQVLSASSDQTAQIWDASNGARLSTLPHAGHVVSAAYSPDAAWVITASADRTAQVWANGLPMGSPLRHQGKLYAAEFSPDGRSVLTVSADRTVRIWEAATGALQRQWSSMADKVSGARFSPDGKLVATGGDSAAISIWSSLSGKLLFRLEEPGRSGRVFAFSPDGRQCLTASSYGTVRIWNPLTGEPVAHPLVHHADVQYAAFSRDSRTVVTCYQDGSVRLWDAATGNPAGSPMMHDGGVGFAEFSPDGQLLATASVDNLARVWHVSTGYLFCQPFRHTERVVQARFSPDGVRLVSAGADGLVQVWDLRHRRSVGLKMQHGGGVLAVAFSPGGDLLLTASLDRTAQLWNARTGRAVGEPMRYEDGVECGDFSADGKRLVTASNDGSAHVRDAGTGQVLAGPLRHLKAIWSVKFSPDGNRVATASADGTARVWEARTGQPVTGPLQHEAEVVSVRFSADGRFVVTASKDSTARIWNADTGAPVGHPLRHADHLRGAEFSPNGERVVTASSDNTACIWDVRTSRPVAPPLQHARIVEKAIFSPDGRRVLTASLDRTARVWDAATGEPLAEPIKHNGPISRGVSFSPDGRRIATSAWKGTVRIWDSDTSRPLTEWFTVGSDILALAFDPTGGRIATGADNGVVRVWDVPPVPTPTPEWFLRFAEALAGVRLGSHGNIDLVPPEEFQALALQLPQSTTNGFYENVVRWFLADPSKRAASPF